MQIDLPFNKYPFYIACILPLIGFTNQISARDVQDRSVASRTISREGEQAMFQQALQSETQITENLIQSYPIKSEAEESDPLFTQKQPCLGHWIQETNYETNIITTEDGAQWRANILFAAYARIVFSYWWLIGDLITIQPTVKFFDYPYQMINKRQGGRLSVELALGPEPYGIHTLWITGYNMEDKTVSLSNDSYWIIADSDLPIFQDWQTNDQIIIGSNNSWFSSYDTILINPQTNNFVRVKTY